MMTSKSISNDIINVHISVYGGGVRIKKRKKASKQAAKHKTMNYQDNNNNEIIMNVITIEGTKRWKILLEVWPSARSRYHQLNSYVRERGTHQDEEQGQYRYRPCYRYGYGQNVQQGQGCPGPSCVWETRRHTLSLLLLQV